MYSPLQKSENGYWKFGQSIILLPNIWKLQGKAADIKSMNPINMVLMIVNESHKISVLEAW